MSYITNNEIYFLDLLNYLLDNYEYASILVEDSLSKSYLSAKSGVSFGENARMTNRGFVIRIFDNGHFAEYSSNLLIPKEEILESIKKNLTVSEFKTFKDIFTDTEKSFSGENIPKEKINDSKILETLKNITDKGLSFSNVLNFQASFLYQQSKKWFISKNRNLYQDNTWAQGSLVSFVKDGEKVRDYYKGYSNLGGMELLSRMEEDIELVVNTSLELLNANPLPPGKYTCICAPEVTGMIVHEAFGHGVEMDMFVKDRALASKHIGEKLASSLVTMHDSASSVKESASYFFDDEGNDATDTVILKDGILQTGMCDQLSANRLGVQPTGNGRRENFERKAYTRMTNTYFEAKKSSLEDMIQNTKDGLLLESASSGMEDPKNWGIQCMVTIAREIKDGKLTGKIYSPIVLTGYVPDVLKDITEMSDTLYLFGSGFCGKGHKEWCKVSDGGPYIKTKINLT